MKCRCRSGKEGEVDHEFVYRVLRRQGLMTTPNSQCALNALAIDNPIEYARLALTGEMQDWVNAEDNLEVW